jgi:hypothetical protein
MSSFDSLAARGEVSNEFERARHLLHTIWRTKISTIKRASVDAAGPLHAERHRLDRDWLCTSISAVRVSDALRENGDAQWLDTASDAGEFGGIMRGEAPCRRRGVGIGDDQVGPPPPKHCVHL